MILVSGTAAGCHSGFSKNYLKQSLVTSALGTRASCMSECLFPGSVLRRHDTDVYV